MHISAGGCGSSPCPESRYIASSSTWNSSSSSSCRCSRRNTNSLRLLPASFSRRSSRSLHFTSGSHCFIFPSSKLEGKIMNPLACRPPAPRDRNHVDFCLIGALAALVRALSALAAAGLPRVGDFRGAGLAHALAAQRLVLARVLRGLSSGPAAGLSLLGCCHGAPPLACKVATTW